MNLLSLNHSGYLFRSSMSRDLLLDYTSINHSDNFLNYQSPRKARNFRLCQSIGMVHTCRADHSLNSLNLLCQNFRHSPQCCHHEAIPTRLVVQKNEKKVISGRLRVEVYSSYENRFLILWITKIIILQTSLIIQQFFKIVFSQVN